MKDQIALGKEKQLCSYYLTSPFHNNQNTLILHNNNKLVNYNYYIYNFVTDSFIAMCGLQSL